MKQFVLLILLTGVAALGAGMPETVAATTVNRFCSSGLQAIAMAAHQIVMEGADDAGRAHAYAESLAQRIADAFPTAAVAAAAERAQDPEEADVVTFFSRTVFHDDTASGTLPDFDLGRTNIEHYLRENPSAAASSLP